MIHDAWSERFVIVLLRDSEGDVLLRFMESQPACLALTSTRDCKCCRETRADTNAKRWRCSEHDAATVYKVLLREQFREYKSSAATSWCRARCLVRDLSMLTSRHQIRANLETRVRDLLSAHKFMEDLSAADLLCDAFRRRCGLSVVEAAGWILSKWDELISSVHSPTSSGKQSVGRGRVSRSRVISVHKVLVQHPLPVDAYGFPCLIQSHACRS